MYKDAHASTRIDKYGQTGAFLNKSVQIWTAMEKHVCASLDRYAHVCKRMDKYVQVCKRMDKHVCTSLDRYVQVCLACVQSCPSLYYYMFKYAHV